MRYPPHIQDDLSDGMDPGEVFAINCIRCGEYIGQMQEFEDRPDPGDHDKLCGACDPEGAEE